MMSRPADARRWCERAPCFPTVNNSERPGPPECELARLSPLTRDFGRPTTWKAISSRALIAGDSPPRAQASDKSSSGAAGSRRRHTMCVFWYLN